MGFGVGSSVFGVTLTNIRDTLTDIRGKWVGADPRWSVVRTLRWSDASLVGGSGGRWCFYLSFYNIFVNISGIFTKGL